MFRAVASVATFASTLNAPLRVAFTIHGFYRIAHT